MAKAEVTHLTEDGKRLQVYDGELMVRFPFEKDPLKCQVFANGKTGITTIVDEKGEPYEENAATFLREVALGRITAVPKQ